MKTTTKLPKERMPKEIYEWLQVNSDVPWQVCVCQCGHWFEYMDHLAPYHIEMSYCKYCDPKNQ